MKKAKIWQIWQKAEYEKYDRKLKMTNMEKAKIWQKAIYEKYDRKLKMTNMKNQRWQIWQKAEDDKY